MQPNYYLLRNNLESGPYTIDELLLQRLTPTDLVWVEGRTNAWCLPSELEELTVSFSINYDKLNELKPKPGKQRIPERPKRIGKDEIENRAEEIRKKILSQPVSHYPELRDIREDDSPTTFKIPEESINLVMHKRKLSLPGAHISAIGIMGIFIAAAWYGKDLWVNNNSRFLDSVAKPFESSSVITVPEKKEVPNQPAYSISALPIKTDSSVNTLVSQDSFAAKSGLVNEPVLVSNKSFIQKKPENRVADSSVAGPGSVSDKSPEPGEKENKSTVEKKDPVQKEAQEKNENMMKKEEPVVKPNGEKEVKKKDTVTIAEPEKKKGFFGRLFKKKKDREKEKEE